MKIGDLKGLYLQYRDVAQPVETVERCVYSFPKEKDRTCLVENPRHIEVLLRTGKYHVVAVEVEDSPSVSIVTDGTEFTNGDKNSVSAKIESEILTPKPEPKKKLGRPRKGA